MTLKTSIPSNIGRRGENAACSYLRGMGHRILERNWRSAHLEIDVISLSSDGLHVVEVKTRVAPAMAMPEENVGRVKQERLVRAANAYLHSAGKAQIPSDVEIFFDIVAVLIDGEKETIEYFPQAFIPVYA